VFSKSQDSNIRSLEDVIIQTVDLEAEINVDIDTDLSKEHRAVHFTLILQTYYQSLIFHLIFQCYTKNITLKGSNEMKKLIGIVALVLIAATGLTACNGTGASTSKFDTSKNISVTAREDGSGTKTSFMELIDLKKKPDPTNTVIQTGTAGILAEVKSNPFAIAYESLGYVTDEVKMIKVDGVEATIANIKNGSYKISRPLSVVYKSSALDNPDNKAFFTFLQSNDAQKIISDNGYVSMVDNAPAYTIDGSLSATIDISGSTSLQPLMIELAAEFEKLQPNVKVTVSGGGSGTGYKNAENATSVFGMISEEFSQDKAASCTHYIVAKDGIAIIVNKSNSLDNIAKEQLTNIYDAEAGDQAISKWDQLTK